MSELFNTVSVNQPASFEAPAGVSTVAPKKKIVAPQPVELKPLTLQQKNFYHLFHKNFGAWEDEEGNAYESIIHNLYTDENNYDVDLMMSMAYDYFGIFEDDISLPNGELDDATVKAATLRILKFCQDRIHLRTEVKKRVSKPAGKPKPLTSAWNVALVPDEDTIEKVQLPKEKVLYNTNPMYRVRLCRRENCHRRGCNYAHGKDELLKPLCALDQTCNDASCQLRHNPRMSEGMVGSLKSKAEYPVLGQGPVAPGSRVRASQKRTNVGNVYTDSTVYSQFGAFGALAEKKQESKRQKTRFTRQKRTPVRKQEPVTRTAPDDGFTVVKKKAKRGAFVPEELLFTHKYMCKFQQQGSCRNGKNCKFAHNQSTVDAANKLHARKSEKACWNGDNCRNADCRYQH